jgi:flagellar hook-associated protein 3 FlgL
MGQVRVADTMTYDQVRGNIGKNRSQMSELQNQAATQKRVTKPSDDPVSASRVLGSRIDLQGNKQYVKNLNYAKSFLEMTDQALGDISENLMRAKELAINQANDASASEETRRVVATEIQQVFNQIISVGNRKLGDRFIFGGFKTQTKPFDDEGRYQGDAGEMMLHIDKETFLPMNMAGNRVFLGEGLSADGIVHSTQQQARTIEEFRQQNLEGDPAQRLEPEAPSGVTMRGPASSNQSQAPEGEPEIVGSGGINLFNVMRQLEISLRVNDKAGVQDSLDTIDQALSQVVLARAQIGSRGMAVDNLLATMERSKVDNQVAISQFEDADVFQTVSDINKTEGTLQATLQTSGKLIQPSLLEFLR